MQVVYYDEMLFPVGLRYEAYCTPWDRDSLIWHSSEGQEYL